MKFWQGERDARDQHESSRERDEQGGSSKGQRKSLWETIISFSKGSRKKKIRDLI